MRVCAIPGPASGGLNPSRLAEDARTLLTRRAPVATVPERLPEPSRRSGSRLGPGAPGDVTSRTRSTRRPLRRMRDRRWSYSSLAPHAIFPLPADDIADVVLGSGKIAW